MRILLILVLIVGVFGVGEVRADFGLTASVVGLGVGVGLVAVPHILDKKGDQDEENGEGKPICLECESSNEGGKAVVDENETNEEEFFKQDLSRTSTEDLKFSIGKRWAK